MTRRSVDGAIYEQTHGANTVAAVLKTLPDSEIDLLKLRVRSRLPIDAAGRIVRTARANAVKGRRPRTP